MLADEERSKSVKQRAAIFRLIQQPVLLLFPAGHIAPVVLSFDNKRSMVPVC